MSAPIHEPHLHPSIEFIAAIHSRQGLRIAVNRHDHAPRRLGGAVAQQQARFAGPCVREGDVVVIDHAEDAVIGHRGLYRLVAGASLDIEAPVWILGQGRGDALFHLD